MRAWIKRFIKWTFCVPEGNRSALKIIGWWEIRRIPYNLFIACLAVVSILTYALFLNLSNPLKPGEDLIEPLLLIFAPIFINIAYTFGWVMELFLRYVARYKDQNIGPILLIVGLSISFIVVISPAILWMCNFISKFL